jgi:hypothetical protein
MAVGQLPTAPIDPNPACLISRAIISIAFRTFCCVSPVCPVVALDRSNDVTTASPAATIPTAMVPANISSTNVIPS